MTGRDVEIDLSDLTPEKLAADEAEYVARLAERKRAEKARRAQEEAEAEARRAAQQAEREKAAKAAQAEREKAAQVEREKAEARAQEMLVAARVLIWLSGNTYAVPWDATPDTEIGRHPDGGSPTSLRQLVERGRLYTRDGKPVLGDARKRLKARLLQTYDDLPLPGEVVPPARDWLIPGLWREGTIPALAGQYKVGKTTLVTTELVPSLVVPGHRFLNYFEPIDSSSVIDEIESRGVWLISVEAPISDVEEGLWPVDQAGRRDFLTVDHLESLGGAKMLDLTDSTIYKLWWHRLSECLVCDGSDFTTPYVVIVDGLTEILLDAGKSLEQDSGRWFVAFKRLMRELDVPNALVVGHATMSGDHGMGGTDFLGLPDGLWSYSSDNPDDPFSKRRFSVVPRGSGVPIPRSQVTLGDDGRLRMHRSNRQHRSNRSSPGEGSAAKPSTEAVVDETIETPTAEPETIEPSAVESVLDYVQRCNANGHGPSGRQIRENVPGRSSEIDAAIAQLKEAGKLEVRPRAARGGGNSYWVTYRE